MAKDSAECRLEDGAMVGDLKTKVADQTTADGAGLSVDGKELLKVLSEAIERAEPGVAENALGSFRFTGRVTLENLLGKGLLAGKVVIKRALGDPSVVEDLLDTRGVVAGGVDELESDVDEVFAGVFSRHYVTNRLVDSIG